MRFPAQRLGAQLDVTVWSWTPSWDRSEGDVVSSARRSNHYQWLFCFFVWFVFLLWRFCVPSQFDPAVSEHNMPTGKVHLLLLTVQCERRTSEETVKKTTDDPSRFKKQTHRKPKTFRHKKKQHFLPWCRRWSRRFAWHRPGQRSGASGPTPWSGRSGSWRTPQLVSVAVKVSRHPLYPES